MNNEVNKNSTASKSVWETIKGFFKKVFRRDVPVAYKRKGASDKIIFVIAFFVFAIYAASIIFFYGWAILASFKTQKEFMYLPTKLPQFITEVKFENYKIALEKFVVADTNFVGMILNSIWYSVGVAFCTIFFHLCTSYVLTRFQFKARAFMYFMIVLYMLLPLYGSGSSTYRLIKGLGIDNSPLYLLSFCGGFSGSTFLILAAAWETVDSSYSEAAEIDGASQFTVFFSIMFPMILGPAGALFIINFIGNWNNYETFVLYLPELPNLALGVYEFSQEMIYEANNPAFFAGVTLAMLPILIFFSIFADKIMEKVAFGSGVKG